MTILCIFKVNSNRVQAVLWIVMIGDHCSRRDALMHWLFLFKGAAHDQPDPGDILLLIDAAHILAVGAAGAWEAGRVTMVGTNDAAWLREFDPQKLFWIELEVDRRGKDVAQWLDLLDVPIALFIERAQQHTARFDGCSLIDVRK